MLGHDLYWEGKNSKPDPPPRGSDWASPRGPEDRLGLEYRSHLDTFCTRTSDANTRFDENILSRIFRIVARRCRYTRAKNFLTFFSRRTRHFYRPKLTPSIHGIERYMDRIFHSNYRDNRYTSKISNTKFHFYRAGGNVTYPIKKIFSLLNEFQNFLYARMWDRINYHVDSS